MSRLAVRHAFETFLDAWERVPPLVRASTSTWVALTCTARVSREFPTVAHEQSLGMLRRAEVTKRHNDAAQAVAELLAALANAADEEAVAAGQGPLVGTAGPSEDPPPSATFTP